MGDDLVASEIAPQSAKKLSDGDAALIRVAMAAIQMQ